MNVDYAAVTDRFTRPVRLFLSFRNQYLLGIQGKGKAQKRLLCFKIVICSMLSLIHNL